MRNGLQRYTRTSLMLSALLVASTSLAAQNPTTRTASVGMNVTLPMSLPNSEQTLLRSFTDANIVAHIAGGDSLEAELSRLAETRATSAQVREFARMLVTDHTAHLQKTLAMAKDEDTGNQLNPSDTSGTHLMHVIDQMRAMPAGEAWDRAFLMHQLMHHQHALLGLRVLREAARDDDLEEHIDEVMPVIQRHLDRARGIAQGMNMTLRMEQGTGLGATTRPPNR
jgi:putative membrane protein